MEPTAIITDRFLKAVNEIILQGRRTKKGIANRKAFAESVGMKPQAFSKISTAKNNVTLRLIYEVVNQYKVNANWLISGKGEMFLSDDSDSLESRLMRIEKKLKIKKPRT